MKNFTLALLFLSSFFGFSQSSDSLELFYESDQYKLTGVHLKDLDHFIRNIPGPNYLIHIDAYTDVDASDIYNLELSKRRSAPVQHYLEQNGIHNIAINNHGEKKQSGDSKASNRKVKLLLIRQPSLPADDTEVAINNFYMEVRDPCQEFCIDNSRDTIIRGAMGTLIHIKANSFELPEHLADPCITFQLREAYLKSQMVLENLATLSNDQILETQGMIYTNAMVGDDTLSLIRDIAIMMPTDTIRKDMQIFNGELDPHGNVMNWALSNNSVLRDFTLKNVQECVNYNMNMGNFRPCGNSTLNILLQDVSDSSNRENCLLYCLGFLKRCDKRCKVFLCRFKRIGKPFQGITSATVRSHNQLYRRCQRNLRKAEKLQRKYRRNASKFNWEKALKKIRRSLPPTVRNGKSEPSEEEQQLMALIDQMEASDADTRENRVTSSFVALCEHLDSLFKVYGVNNTEQLIYALNQPLMEEFGVTTISALIDTLPKVNLSSIELAYQNKSLSYDDFKFYIYNTSNLGWANCDAFADIPPNELADQRVNLQVDKTTDVKLVFKDREFVIAANLDKDGYYFSKIPKNEQAYLIGIKYQNATPQLSLELIKTGKKPLDLNFETKSLEELKTALQVLDFATN